MKKVKWSLMGMPPMQEPKLIELGKLRFGAAGVAASIVILLPLKDKDIISASHIKIHNFQIVMNLVERFPRNDEKVHKGCKGKNLRSILEYVLRSK